LPPSTFTCFLPRFKVYEIRASFRPFLNEVLAVSTEGER